MRTRIADLERAQGQVEPLTYAAPEIVAAIPALLRLARAAKKHASGLCEEMEEALDAFDWSES